MQYERICSRCRECSLGVGSPVWGCGRPGGLIFLGEAPGKDEVEKGEPFVGPAGRELYKACKFGEVEIELWQNWKTNLVACRYPSNDFDALESEEGRECCQKGFLSELKYLHGGGSQVIVTLGAKVPNYLGISGALPDIRGSVFEWNGFWVIPTYHPAFFARHHGSWKKGDGGVMSMRLAWLNDLAKAKRIARNGWKPPTENFQMFPTIKELEAYVEECTKHKCLIAVDIETTGLNADFTDIVVIGLADTATHGVAVPFLKCGGGKYWTTSEVKQVQQLVERLFRECPLMFQNAFFDVPFLRTHGFDISFENVKHDTMLLHHTISPEQPHNLGYIGSIYGETPYWKADLLERKGTILQMPDKQLRTYNLRDCVVLHQLLPPMLEDLHDMGTQKVYKEEVIPLMPAFGAMMERGIYLKRENLTKLKSKYERATKEQEEALRELRGIPKGFNFDSPADMAWLFYGQEPTKFKKLEDLAQYDKAAKKPLKKDTKKYRQLVALKAIKEEVQPLVLPKGFKPRKTRAGSSLKSDEQEVLKMILEINNRISTIESLKVMKTSHEVEKSTYLEEVEFLEKFLEYKESSKILSTYTSYSVRSDGRVHTQILMHGTATGRPSSRKPNLLNLPKERIDLRTPFAATPGMVILSADYSNLEVRVLAAVTGDKPLLETIRSGANIHDENTRVLFQFDPNDSKWKSARNAAKVFQFGKVQYGGGDREIFERMLIKAPKLGLTFRAFCDAARRWEAEHPAIVAWQEKAKKRARDERVAVCWNGRKRELLGSFRDLEKQGLNTPIQGGAAAIINQAMVRIHERLQELNINAYMLLQIYDQLVFEVVESDLEALVAMVKEEMERPIPALPIDFPVDVELGPDMGSLKEYKDENSDSLL